MWSININTIISQPLYEADIWLIAVSPQVSSTLIFGYAVVS